MQNPKFFYSLIMKVVRFSKKEEKGKEKKNIKIQSKTETLQTLAYVKFRKNPLYLSGRIIHMIFITKEITEQRKSQMSVSVEIE